MNKKHILFGIISVVTFFILSFPSNAMDQKRKGEDDFNGDVPPRLKKQKTDYPTLGCQIKITFAEKKSQDDVQTSWDASQDCKMQGQNRLKLIFKPITALTKVLNLNGTDWDTMPPDYIRYGTAIVNYLENQNNKVEKFVVKLLHLPEEGEDEVHGCMNALNLVPKECNIPKMLEYGKPKSISVLRPDVLREVHKNSSTQVDQTTIEDPFVIIFKTAPGEDIYTVLKKEAGQAEKIESAFKAVAEYLGKLHVDKMTIIERNDPEVGRIITERENYEIKGANTDEDREKFQEIFKEKRDSFYTRKKNQSKYRIAVAHNDCHSGNIFYDASKIQSPYQAVTLIDYADMKVKGDFVHDVGRFIASLWQWCARTYVGVGPTQEKFDLFQMQKIIEDNYISSLKEKISLEPLEETILRKDIHYYKYQRIRGIVNHRKNEQERAMTDNLIKFVVEEIKLSTETEEKKSQTEGNSASVTESASTEEKATNQHLNMFERVWDWATDFLVSTENKADSTQDAKERIKESASSESEDFGKPESAVVWKEPMLIKKNSDDTIPPIVTSPSLARKGENTTDFSEEQTSEDERKAQYATAAAWNLFWPLTNGTDGNNIWQKAQKALNQTLESKGQAFTASKNTYLGHLNKANEEHKKDEIATHINNIQEITTYDKFYEELFILRVNLLKQYHDPENKGRQCHKCSQHGLLIKKVFGERMGKCWVCGFQDDGV